MMGDAWVAGGAGLILQVPSVVTVGEANYLVNPLHSGFPELSLGTPVEFEPDARLLPEN